MRPCWKIFVWGFVLWAVACDDTNKTDSKGLEYETELSSDSCLSGFEGCSCTPSGYCAVGLMCISNICQIAKSDSDIGTDSTAETDEPTDNDSEENGTDSEQVWDSETECTLGTRGCACFVSRLCGGMQAPPNMGMCNPGLVCVSDLCIHPEDVDTEQDSSPESDADADACGDIDLDYSAEMARRDTEGGGTPDVDEIKSAPAKHY